MAMAFAIPGDLSTTVNEGIGHAELTVREVWQQYIWHPIRAFDVWDLIDIFLLTLLLYAGYLFIKGRRAGKLAIGIGVILVFYVISDLSGLRALHQLLAGVAPFFIVLLAVIFQPELRDALEQLGTTPFGFFSLNKDERDDLARTVNEVVEAACYVAVSEKDGALMVIESSTALGEHAKDGHRLDAVVSHELLGNIFVDRSPLHDGAVIIRKNRIAAAGCKLPLSSNEAVVGGYGTRHRAAVGITEKSDCVSVVVSEERHVISICYDGEIKSDYNYSADDLRNDNRLKTIQNALRNDLFLLLAEISYDENSRNEKPKFQMPAIKFSWSLLRSREQAASKGQREQPEEVRETAGAPARSRFSKARRYDKRTGQGTTVRRFDDGLTDAVLDSDAEEVYTLTEAPIDASAETAPGAPRMAEAVNATDAAATPSASADGSAGD